MSWSAIAESFAQPLNGRVTPPTSPRGRPPQVFRLKQPFYLTVAATRQRIFRKLIEANLPIGEWRVMKFFMERWWKHEAKGLPLAYGCQAIADALNYSVVQIKRIMKALIERGFLRVAFGGVGRGKVRRFAVDFTAILRAFAPGLLRSEKVSSSDGAYRETLRVAPAWIWFSGLWGRSDRFRGSVARCLAAEASATWRSVLGRSQKAAPWKHIGTRSDVIGLEAGA